MLDAVGGRTAADGMGKLEEQGHKLYASFTNYKRLILRSHYMLFIDYL